jgi:spore maturation protein SpmA
MLNGIFVFIVLISILLAAFSGQMQQLTDAMLAQAGAAVKLSIGLVGVMTFFLGLMQVAQDAGLLRVIARLLSPIMRRLFPSVPADHPAMSAMILNISSNMLGLANASTPFGIKAMEELNKLNGRKGTATNAMVLFLAINTAGLAILPSGVIGLRAAAGSEDAAGIFFTTWFASGAATLVGIMAAFLLSRLPRYRSTEPPVVADVDYQQAGDITEALGEDAGKQPQLAVGAWRKWGALLVLLVYLGLMARQLMLTPGEQPILETLRGLMSFWILPLIVGSIVMFGWARGTRVYESLVGGAKEGFQVALRIIPYLVAIMVAVGMFRASGGIDLIVGWLGPFTERIGMPAAALPMAILRPLSGSGAFGVMTEAMAIYGPDSLIGYMVSTFQGSTETTFYVLAVYFGAVGVKQTRHTLPACLLADIAGILAAVFIVNLIFG